MKYYNTSIYFGAFLFFFIGIVDKIISQSKWGWLDLLFTLITSVFAALMFFSYKNKK